MAEFRKIVPSAPISQFRQYQPGGGEAFGLLADAMEVGYKMLLPAAKQEMETLGDQAGYELARRNIGAESTIAPISVSGKNVDDGFDWTKRAIGGATRPDGISGLKPEMRGALASMFQAADAELGPGMQIHSGYRSEGRQAEIIASNMAKYGLGGRVADWNADVASMGPVAAGQKWRGTFQSAGLTKWVGMPGGSRHQHGDAADLSFNGKSLGQADPKVQAWVRNNAPRFGMHVPMAHEPWEVRLRGGPRVSMSSKGGSRSEDDFAGGAPMSMVTTTALDENAERRMRTFTDASARLDALLAEVAPREIDRRAAHEPVGGRRVHPPAIFPQPMDRRADFEPIEPRPHVTYDQWKGMTRKQRTRAGLPVSTWGGAIFFSNAFGTDQSTAGERRVNDARAANSATDTARAASQQPPPPADRMSFMWPELEPDDSEDPRHREIRGLSLDVKRKAQAVADDLLARWQRGEGASPQVQAMERTLKSIDDALREAGETERGRAKGKLDAEGTVADGTADPQVRPPQTMVMTAEGKTEPRLFSPLSGPLLQLHNAAAGVAYLSEVENQAVRQMMDLGNQFQNDPQGFERAMQGFISEAVSQAPSMFRGDVRKKLSGLAQRRILGMHEEQQRDTRQRAANANGALVDRYGDELATALVSGDEAAIAAAREQLNGALRVRETLPGIAWTPEQSFNAVARAEKQAESARAQAQKEAATSAKSTMRSIRDAAKAGMVSADEALLSSLVDADPALAAEAMAWVNLRDGMPEIFKMTPAELAQLSAEMKANPVQSDFQVDIAKAIEGYASEQKKAFKDDPVARAQQVLPGLYPDIDTSTPDAFGESIAERITSAMALAGFDENGERTLPRYTNEIALLSKEEQAQIAQFLGPENDPQIRLAYAAAAVKTMGADSARLFQEARVDPGFKMGAMMLANGGDEAMVSQALRGQEMRKSGMVVIPGKGATISTIGPEIAKAVGHIPVEAQADIKEFALDIYAAQAVGVDPNSDAASELLKKSLNQALGQSTDRRGQLTGGVQKVGRNPEVLLPIGVTAGEAESALRTGIMGFDPEASAMSFMQGFNREQAAATRERMWAAAGAASGPMLGGQPLDPQVFHTGKLQLVPHPSAKNFYMMMVNTGSNITDVRDVNGNAFMFNLVDLIEAME
jgi:hypothetical protein